ncbi:hypothetical protein FACS189429_8820 [Bacteroidia bacterium]|nr:hypothetical protein FACS189429_8820 [Bacteroidia bacterium]GHV45007.1 hypothetical protein FACS1894180_7050 [Bacteroidia bacterium]
MVVLYSCKTICIYHNDTSNLDDGEIWGSNVNLFFGDNDNIRKVEIKSLKLSNELRKIKEQIMENGNDFYKDDACYNYAFITHTNDTIYCNEFVVWRYKKKTINNNFPAGAVLQAVSAGITK